MYILYYKSSKYARYKYVSKLLQHKNLYQSDFIKIFNFKKKKNKTSIYKACKPYKCLFIFNSCYLKKYFQNLYNILITLLLHKQKYYFLLFLTEL